jgi:hypothetical protein
MNQHLPHIDATRVDKDNAREVLRLSELYLDNTTKFAIASDARAVTLSTVMATLMTATAAVGAAIVALPPEYHSKFTLFISVVSIASSFCFMMALIQASKAGQPEEFDVPGNYFSSFTEGDLCGDPRTLLIAQARVYERQIHLNKERLKVSAKVLQAALAWVKFSPVVALLAGVIALAVLFPSG